MSTSVYLTHSDPLIHRRLVEHAVLDEGVATLVESRREADMILYLHPRQPESDARDPLRSFRLRDLLRTYVYSQLDNPFPWAPGIYVSLPAARATKAYTGGFYVAGHHHEPGGLAEEIEAARGIEPDLLWSFMGTIKNHPIRERLLAVPDKSGMVQNTERWDQVIRWNWRDHGAESRNAFSSYANSLGRSSFVLCPRGRGASSFRIFEAMWAGRPPVIVSDDWLPPPFVDWSSCSLRIPEADVGEIPTILREREGEAGALGRQARLVWEQFFSPQQQLNTLISACLAIADTPPSRPAVFARALLQPATMRQGLRKVKSRLPGNS